MVDLRDPESLLAAYRADAGPPPGVEARLLRRLLKAPVTPAPSTTWGIKGVVSVVGMVVVAAGVIGVLAADPEPTEPGPAAAPPPTAKLAPDPPLPLPTAVAPAPTDRRSERASEPVQGHTPKQRRPARRPAAAPEPAGSPSMAEELRLVRQVDAALRGDDLVKATVLLEEHARRFPAGALAGETEGLGHILACRRDEPGARERATAWTERHHGGGLAGRVRAACPESGPEETP